MPFRYPANLRRRYERLDRFPEGLLAFGDAMCSFNPIYGQGMTVAPLEALALRDALRAGDADLAPRFFRKRSPVTSHGTSPSAPTCASPRRRPAYEEGAARQPLPQPRPHGRRTGPGGGHAFLRVVNLIDRPEKLLAPPVAARVLRANLRRRRSPRPGAGGAPARAATTEGLQ